MAQPFGLKLRISVDNYPINNLVMTSPITSPITHPASRGSFAALRAALVGGWPRHQAEPGKIFLIFIPKSRHFRQERVVIDESRRRRLFGLLTNGPQTQSSSKACQSIGLTLLSFLQERARTVVRALAWQSKAAVGEKGWERYIYRWDKRVISETRVVEIKNSLGVSKDCQEEREQDIRY